MTQEKKQTALQWYRRQIMAVFTGDSENKHMTEGQIFARALEMEREQHQETFLKGFVRTISGSDFVTFKEYFNKTYGKEAQP